MRRWAGLQDPASSRRLLHGVRRVTAETRNNQKGKHEYGTCTGALPASWRVQCSAAAAFSDTVVQEGEAFCMSNRLVYI